MHQSRFQNARGRTSLVSNGREMIICCLGSFWLGGEVGDDGFTGKSTRRF